MSRLASSPAGKKRAQRSAAILGIGTVSPPTLAQARTVELVAELGCQTVAQRQWLARVFLRTGIERRGLVLLKKQTESGNGADPVRQLREFYPPAANESDRGPTTAARMRRYAAEAPELAQAAAARAMAHGEVAPEAITHLITVSCTGFVAPGLDTLLIGRLGLSPNIRRLHVGFMGCHGAFNALAAARDAVLADSSARVLVCSVELCSLHLAYGFEPGKVVANALFGDGAGAVVVGRRQAGDAGVWNLRDTASYLIPRSLEAMTWTIGDHGFEMTLSPRVPGLVREHLRPWCLEWLRRNKLRIGDIAGWAIHPGGPKVLTAVAEALELPPAALEHSRAVLAEQGNISSATVLFILQRMSERVGPGPCVAIGLGPGLMAEGMLVER
jgi:predicted naringenin-chalcone synthase